MNRYAVVGVRRALPADADAIVLLRDEVAQWLLDRGVRQWQPGEVTRPDVLAWMGEGRLYVAEQGGSLVGTVRLAWGDPEVWDPPDPEVGYVQALMTARSFAGRGLGRTLLAHVESVAADTGRTRMRLSCLHGNEPLERFYLSAGYTIVGMQEFDRPGWEPVTLLEKVLSVS